jgi:hypothetical protein
LNSSRLTIFLLSHHKSQQPVAYASVVKSCPRVLFFYNLVLVIDYSLHRRYSRTAWPTRSIEHASAIMRSKPRFFQTRLTLGHKNNMCLTSSTPLILTFLLARVTQHGSVSCIVPHTNIFTLAGILIFHILSHIG